MSINDQYSKAVALRNRIVSRLLKDTVSIALKTVLLDKEGAEIEDTFPAEDIALVASDLDKERGWKDEYWKILSENDAVSVSQKEFTDIDRCARFSRNTCLRRPAKSSLFLRAYLSAFQDKKVLARLTDIYGHSVSLASHDIAKYSKADFLRRHSDTFDNRVFGFVTFFSHDWKQGYGGELIVEGANGETSVITPIAGKLAIIPIKAHYYHQVCRINVKHWDRISVATHFTAN